MKNIILTILIFSAGFLGLVKFGLHVAHKQEQKECATWAAQAKEYPKFYYTEWQKVQCGLYDM